MRDQAPKQPGEDAAVPGAGAGGADRLRFRRPQRVRSGRDFQRAWRAGGRARGKLITVVAAANGLSHARLGLSVGRRIWRGAVPRNRLRRLLREAFRLEQYDLPVGFDLVLVPAEPRLAPPLAELRRELVSLARKAAGRARPFAPPSAPPFAPSAPAAPSNGKDDGP